MSLFKISSRLQHALSLLSYLARDEKGFFSLNEVAQHYRLSQGYLEEISTDLKKRNLIKSRKGSTGGYCLARPAERIWLLEIFNAVDAESLAFDCLNASQDFDCNADEEFAMRKVWAGLNGVILAQLSSITLKDIAIADNKSLSK